MDLQRRAEPRTLIFDPFSGISGDMIVGALVDLGLPESWLRDSVAALGLPAGVVVERVDRSGIACARVRFEVAEERSHRHLADILEIVANSGASEAARAGAAEVFRRLAEAEAAVHGIPVERVHFHEVGALDSILDVLCSIGGVHELGFERFFTRPVAVGSGTVDIAHGAYPLPAPATARLLDGMVVRETGYREECTTPTGASILAVLTGGAQAPREVVYGRSGFGAGSRDPAGRPNCLRLIACSIADPAERVYLVQADVDDLSPEYVAAARDGLSEAGALDVTLTRIDMKKGRPGVRLEVLAPEASLTAVTEALFIGTRTIGVRYWEVARSILDREEQVVEWRGQRIRRKRVRLPDGRFRAKPEYEDVVAAARALGLAPHEVRVELDDGW
jgi:pyridinium-3,5-bisthiocarboxylic acid mononucleotide nickel chelatase